jgi:hypothetical protein
MQLGSLCLCDSVVKNEIGTLLSPFIDSPAFPHVRFVSHDRPEQSTNRPSVCKRAFSALYVCLSLPTLPHSVVISGR